MIKEVHYYVSNDPMHDTLLVQHVFMLHWCHLTGQGCFTLFGVMATMDNLSLQKLGTLGLNIHH